METVTDYVAAGSFADLAENVKYLTTPSYAQLIRTTDLKSNFINKDFIYVDKKAFDYLWRVNLNTECIIMPNIGNCGEIYYINPEKLPYKHNVLGPNAIYIKSKKQDNKFLSFSFQSDSFQKKLSYIISPNGQTKFNKTELKMLDIIIPNIKEQQKVGQLLYQLDNLITLHQCEQMIEMEEKMNTKKKILLVNYYEKWIETYKNGAVRKVTLAKYKLALRWLKKLEPKLKISDLNRNEYQNLINSYAESHERQTTMDFHHQLKAAILDAVDEG